MTQRLDIHTLDPAAHKAVYALERYVRESGLDQRLDELVKIRASQLNSCAFCLDTQSPHTNRCRTKLRSPDLLPGIWGRWSAAWRRSRGAWTVRA